jgi:hypothetical protein
MGTRAILLSLPSRCQVSFWPQAGIDRPSGPGGPADSRLAAATAFLDRASGRPTLPIAADFKDEVAQMTDQELMAFVREETLELAPKLGLTLIDVSGDTHEHTPRP